MIYKCSFLLMTINYLKAVSQGPKLGQVVPPAAGLGCYLCPLIRFICRETVLALYQLCLSTPNTNARQPFTGTARAHFSRLATKSPLSEEMILAG